MSKWYMTVGYPGGEFASTDIQALTRDALDDGPISWDANFSATDTEEIDSGSMAADWFIRPCPPDLVEWIEADSKVGIQHPESDSIRYKRPGGWMETVFFSNQQNTEMISCSTVFLSVAGAAGLTIIEEATP